MDSDKLSEIEELLRQIHPGVIGMKIFFDLYKHSKEDMLAALAYTLLEDAKAAKG